MVCFIAGLQLKHFKQRTLKPSSGSDCIYNQLRCLNRHNYINFYSVRHVLFNPPREH